MVRMKKSAKKDKVILQSPKGMRDILPVDQLFWDKTRNAVSKIAKSFDFQRIDTPIMENAAVFERTGEATDIVEKQMFFVKSRGNDRLVLKPEGTASIMRAYLQHGLSKLPQPLKLFYFSPIFRYEQPQAGRFRQHHQAGFEILGGSGGADPIYDAMAISVLFRLLEELKIKNLIIQINDIGCKNCRPGYIKKLQEYYKRNLRKVCKNCRKRFSNRPLRILDCKEEKCAIVKADAPIIIDKICSSCKKHFKAVLEYLDEISLPYLINNYLVRGLDYYNGPVFEIFSEARNDLALASGGRYDYLSEMLANAKVSAVGGAAGIERLIEIMKFQGIEIASKDAPDAFLIHIGDEAKKKNFVVLEELRKAGIKATGSFEKDSLRSQLRVADKTSATLALILGQKEVFEESIIIRNMKTGSQENVALKKVVEEVKKRLK